MALSPSQARCCTALSLMAVDSGFSAFLLCEHRHVASHLPPWSFAGPCSQLACCSHATVLAAEIWRGLCGCLQQSLLVRYQASGEEFPTYVQQCGTVRLQGKRLCGHPVCQSVQVLQPGMLWMWL